MQRVRRDHQRPGTGGRRRHAGADLIRGALLAAALVSGPLLPGLGPQDPRRPVDVAQFPWSAVVLVQVPGVARCTGFLVDDHTALTAAHCLYSPHVRHLVRPDSIHVLSGYQRGQFAAHTLVVGYRVAAGWDMLDQGRSGGVDAVLLALATPLAGRPLALAGTLPGRSAMLGGYEQDRAQVLLADTACRVMGTGVDPKGRPVRQHSCAATEGTSGAPLLVRATSGEWAAAGLQIAATLGEAGGVAVPDEVLATLMASK